MTEPRRFNLFPGGMREYVDNGPYVLWEEHRQSIEKAEHELVMIREASGIISKSQARRILESTIPDRDLAVGDLVSKASGDYRFDGVVVAVFPKLDGKLRIVVEDDRGVLFIANMQGYKRRPPA